MGMAASQARYLALTARKTNTEWEGQQINQARTALANQSANLFNRLLAMEVPNAPKTTDYTELQYSYTDGENESVIEEWHQLSNKNADYNYRVTHYYFADIFTGSKKLLADPQVQVGDVLKEMKFDKDTSEISFDNNKVTVKYKINNEERNLEYSQVDAASLQKEGFPKALNDFAKAKNLVLNEHGLPSDDNVYYRQDSDGVWHFYLAKINETEYDTHITQEMVNDEENYPNLKEALRAYGYLDENNQIKAEYIDTEHDNKTKIYGLKTTDSNKTLWQFVTEDTGIADEAVRYKGYSVDNKDYSTAYNEPKFVGNSKLNELNELIVNDEIDQVADLAQILRDCPDSSVNKYVHFDGDGNLVYSGSGIYTFNLNGKSYYTTNDDLWNSIGKPYDPNKPIDLQEKLAYYNASYIEKKIEATDNALLETDSNGRFKTVRFDNDSVVYSLNVETVTDEAAYQNAMNEYLYKKEQYEKTIADINAKTSIIQQEDRTLELRLKQLDTEQNALATEMDAVKKVIKDNVEKTFKTFSD